jgi:hypothetical protein
MAAVFKNGWPFSQGSTQSKSLDIDPSTQPTGGKFSEKDYLANIINGFNCGNTPIYKKLQP